MIAVMQAYADGKKIEIGYRGSGWTDVEEPSWDWINYDYRIKPEPKYRPYENAEEFLADWRKHGGLIKTKDNIRYVFLTTFDRYRVGNDIMSITYGSLFKGYVWDDDGSVCGKLKEE